MNSSAFSASGTRNGICFNARSYRLWRWDFFATPGGVKPTLREILKQESHETRCVVHYVHQDSTQFLPAGRKKTIRLEKTEY